MTVFRRLKNAIVPSTIGRQSARYDCAIWAMKAVCFHLRLKVPPARLLRDLAAIDETGASVMAVKETLENVGVRAQAVTGPPEAIVEASFPAIALIKNEAGLLHYVVVLKANQRRIVLLDPAMGGTSKTISLASFTDQFTGDMLICDRRPDYVDQVFEPEVQPGAFIAGVARSEVASVFALILGSVMQLAMAVVGLLLLKNFLGSTSGSPNFWYIGGMVLCAGVHVWVGSLASSIQSEVKSRMALWVWSRANSVMQGRSSSLRTASSELADRCMKTVVLVSDFFGQAVAIPGSAASILLFIAFMFLLDFYAGVYAALAAIVFPIAFVLLARYRTHASMRMDGVGQRARQGMDRMLGGDAPPKNVADDLPWVQASYCQSIAATDRIRSHVSTLPVVMGRLNVVAGLTIGGLQHEVLGLSHTVFVFLALGIYSQILGKWASQLAVLPELGYRVRSMLELFSEFRPSQKLASGRRSPAEEIHARLLQSRKVSA